jgi:hypothetical protein
MSDTTTTSSVGELERRVKQAAKVMGIAGEMLWTFLGGLGIEKNEDGLALLESDAAKEGDARSLMVDGNGWGAMANEYHDATSEEMSKLERVKVVRFNAGWSILKGRGQSASVKEGNGVDKLVEALRPISQYSDEELIAKYGPDADESVLDELRRRSHDRAFVVFSGDMVEAATTLKLLRIARRGETPKTHPFGNGIARVWPVGAFPMLWIEECPIHSNAILADGYCDECAASWSKVPHVTRVALRIGIDERLIQPALSMAGAVAVGNFEASMDSYSRLPRVALRFEELKDEQRLPVLRRRMSQGSRGSDPFYVRK